jgi:hypothetical protein
VNPQNFELQNASLLYRTPEAKLHLGLNTISSARNLIFEYILATSEWKKEKLC